MALHINDLITRGVEEGDVEETADVLIGGEAGTLVDALLIIAQLDPLHIGEDAKPAWTPTQLEMITKANDWLAEQND